MRSVLIVVLAFIIGVFLTLAVAEKPGTRAAGASMATAGASPVAAGSGAPAPVSSVSSEDEDSATDTGREWPDSGPSPEQVLYAQPGMVRNALAQLTPRVAGTPNLYVLAFAGDGGEDVFGNEADYTSRMFAQRFGATTHTVILANNQRSLLTRPLASWSNLEAALGGLANVMHLDQDVLLVYITTHGDEAHNLLVDMDPLPLDQIGPADLAGILGKHAFKWKVVVVNACYSGGFIPALRGAGTLVLTSARTDRSSFGCGSDSQITYFGKAWLVDGLNQTPDFIDAFKLASREISAWERADKLTASEPQVATGAGIAAQLALWRHGITPGSPVAFKPAKPVRSRVAAQKPVGSIQR